MKSSVGSAKTADVPEGGHLVDACDHHLAPIPFSCRSASCATCQIEVLAGADLLEPPGDDELNLLEVLAAPSNVRLACQACVKPGPGVLRIKPVGA